MADIPGGATFVASCEVQGIGEGPEPCREPQQVNQNQRWGNYELKVDGQLWYAHALPERPAPERGGSLRKHDRSRVAPEMLTLRARRKG